MRILINLILFGASLLPHGLSRLCGRFLGFLLHRVIKLKRRIIVENLSYAYPEMNEGERARLIGGIYSHFGQLIMEMMRLPFLKRLKTVRRVKVTGYEENVLPVVESGRGICMLTGHTGNWELGGLKMIEIGFKNYPIVKEMKSAAGTHLLKRIRTDNGLETLPRHNSIRKVISLLRSGSPVTFVIDQNMTSDEGVFVEFFGRPACTMPSLAVMAKKTGSAVIPAELYREKDGSYHLVFHSEIPRKEDIEDNAEDILHHTALYTAKIEEMIRKNPEQWIWMHKRWKTRPDEELEPKQTQTG